MAIDNNYYSSNWLLPGADTASEQYLLPAIVNEGARP